MFLEKRKGLILYSSIRGSLRMLGATNVMDGRVFGVLS